MDHFDDLLAHRDAVLRLKVRRLAATTAARGCRVAATGCRYRQRTDPRLLFWGGVAVYLEALA